MSLEELDLNELAAPISDAQPSGRDLREDASPKSEYREIRDERAKASRAERQAQETGEESTDAINFWRSVVKLGVKILGRQAKDLEVLACLIEGLLRTDGFGGLKFGLQLSLEIVDRFWGTLYPLPDEDGLDTTVRPLAQLNGPVLAQAFLRVPLTQGSSLGPFAGWQYRQATDLERYSDREREARIARGAVTHEQFNRAVSETAPGFFKSLLDDLNGCLAALQAFDEKLQEKWSTSDSSEPPPSFSLIREGLEDVLTIVRSISKDRLPQEAPVVPAAAGGAVVTGSGDATGMMMVAAPMVPGLGPLRNREDAFEMLGKIAEFMERLEPQSLLPSQLRKLVKEGRMTPAEYLAVLIEDSEMRGRLYKMTGLKPPEESN